MKEFRLCDYYTYYSCSGSFSKHAAGRPCFSEVFDYVQNNSNMTYKVKMYRGCAFERDNYKLNACLLSKKEIRNHLKQAQRIYPFIFSIGSKTEGKYKAYEVTLEVKGVPSGFHKYILTWLRYLYEFPYNVMLLDAYRLKKDPIFRFHSIANIFNLVLGCYSEEIRNIHQVPSTGINEWLKGSELQQRLLKVDRLNNVYKVISKAAQRIPSSARGLSVRDVEYWEDESIFTDFRKPVYMGTFNNKIKK